jgi:hypothetical protein
MENVTERPRLPKQAYDGEYMTEHWREVQFLAERGIPYTFVRKTRDYGVSQYKYKKTPHLFATLVEYYSLLEAEKTVRKREEIRKAKEAKIPEEKAQEESAEESVDDTE